MVDFKRRRKRERSTYVCFTKCQDLRVMYKVDLKSKNIEGQSLIARNAR